MFVVIVGSRLWQGQKAEERVNAVLDAVKEKYGSSLVVVTSSTDKGAGKIIRERCMKDRQQFQFIDLPVRAYCNLAPMKLQQVFAARDRALADIAEESHVFIDKDRRGAFEDFAKRQLEMKRPVSLHLVDGSVVAL